MIQKKEQALINDVQGRPGRRNMTRPYIARESLCVFIDPRRAPKRARISHSCSGQLNKLFVATERSPRGGRGDYTCKAESQWLCAKAISDEATSPHPLALSKNTT
ncbi:hypothetical protein N7449_003293 [Penicillium cf. viridicatum]|uniref:Uncharacterized protein n=1 Tax=Penicillium cf. viridicatum TaxID=2972119 RepID=A0A9W9MX03_9EURO|nr:hypothetical protein N7449_003293 [Penicillium cf. viridicatum]